MVWDFIRGVAKSIRTAEQPGRYDAMQLEHFHWRCECGGHSRGGWLLETDAEYGARRHQWSNGIDHPAPEIYSTPTG